MKKLGLLLVIVLFGIICLVSLRGARDKANAAKAAHADPAK